MLSLNLLIIVSGAYVAALFGLAWYADRRARRGHGAWLRSPLIYTLSLSIYCTAWTFYGAVGYAARSGLEFVTIYLGPTLVVLGWWALLRRLVRIGRSERLTSIADLISSRYGKSTMLGVLVTLLAVVGATPYISLQLQSVALSFAVFLEPSPDPRSLAAVAFWVAVGLAVFTIMFGTRHLDVNERHHGVVTAIAVEAVVKLVALLSVGIFVTWGLAGGPRAMMDIIAASPIETRRIEPARWSVLIFLAAAAFLCLPRMFQVMVVENVDEAHLGTASWAFPLYLLLMSLFVLPIAAMGVLVAPEGNPDLFVLTVPLATGGEGLAMLAFLGGFSSATSMVIVAAIAIATMISNHIVMPLWLSLRGGGASMSGDVREVVLRARRMSIVAILALGYLYFVQSGGGEALAAIGLVAFVGVSQVLPALLGGLYWRGATRSGAAAGIGLGFAVWLWTSFLPSIGPGVLSAAVLETGPFGIGWLRPTALFGTGLGDPLLHAVFWSLALNTLAFVAVSLISFPSPLERLQGAAFVNVFRITEGARGWSPGATGAEDLLMMSQRIIGASESQALFAAESRRQGKTGYLPDVTPDFVERLERALAGSVGAATAHAMIAQILGGASVTVEDLMRVADEAQQILEYSSQLETKSEELERTARQLRVANETLTDLARQKDRFLSQISHELRTPMTSIRSFSEVLMAEGRVDTDARRRFSRIIHDETLRLTRLLDDLLDLSVLENGQVTLNETELRLDAVIDRALASVAPAAEERGLVVRRDPAEADVRLVTDGDRLTQVFINILSNAIKYCDAARPEVEIRVGEADGRRVVDLTDNGSGVPLGARSLVFEKFARATDDRKAGGAGLGLAICREIMTRLGGAISYLPGQAGASFRVVLPGGQAARAAE